jgi:hypothetical protein
MSPFTGDLLNAINKQQKVEDIEVFPNAQIVIPFARATTQPAAKKMSSFFIVHL